MQIFSTYALAVLCAVSAAEGLSVTPRATTCNGHAELCERSYGAVSFVGAHNSYAVGINNVAATQDHDVTQQLNDQVRLLQLQVHMKDGAVHLCHTNCLLLDAGPLQKYLETVKTWMNTNPNEVVTILIVNSENLAPSVYAGVFDAAGLDAMAYAPESASLPATSWPTLGSMIDSGKRLVVFLSTTANYAEVPWLIDEFTNVWETKFNAIDTTFACEVDRSKGEPSTQMFLINHYKDKMLFGNPAPDRDTTNTTNAASGVGSLGQEVETCKALHTRNPNFLLVNWYEFGVPGGSVFEVAASANGVTYAPTSAIAVPISETSGGSSTNSTGNGNGSGTTVTALNGSATSLKITITGVVGIFLGAMSVAFIY